MKDAKGHGSDSRGGSMPLQGHPYHTKTNDELRYITKDASAAAKNMQGIGNAQAEGKYLDQVNDASTVLGFRQRGGADLSKSPATDVAAQHGISTAHLGTPEYQAGLLRDAHSLGASMKAKGQPRASLPGASSELKDAYMKGYRGK